MDKSTYLVEPELLLPAVKELRSIRDILRWGFTQLQQADLFYGHGTDNAWDEIIYLVLGTLKLGSRLKAAWLGARLTSTERSELLARIARRVNERVPVAYLVNQAWFAGLPFYVDSRVLIPRSPIAELIEQQFSPWIDADRVDSILDFGTGSGCIAIACAYAFPKIRIDALDCSTAALEVAAINVARHKLHDRVTLLKSNGFEGLEERRYNIIVANPPYVDGNDYAALPAEYRHEPAIALAAGKDGLTMVMQCLRKAKFYLEEEGLLIVEVGNSKAALVSEFPHIPFLWLEFEMGTSEVFLLTKEQLTRL